MNKVFFKGLNELRAIAALAVVIHHIELCKKRDGHSSLFSTVFEKFIMGLGQNGVYLFYVLSGFLITFLLLCEIQDIGRIDFRKFYIRRMLKIWPLYYFLLVISLFFLPLLVESLPLFQKKNYYVDLIHYHYDHWALKLLVFVFFLPNLAILLFKPVAAFSHSKSVGVEEQFYLFWPVLIQYFHKRLLWVLIGVIFVRFVIMAGLSYTLARHPLEWLKILHNFFVDFKIELMAIGGFVAYARFYHWKYIQRISLNKLIAIITCISILICIFIKINSFYMGFLFAILILLTINEKTNIFKNTILDFLGKISYGIYMYHPLMMFVSFILIYELDLFKYSSVMANIVVHTYINIYDISKLAFLSIFGSTLFKA